MKPIIIEIRDNKISMDVNEFKKHIEDAYSQGYRDASSCSTITNTDPYWWRSITINGTVSDTTASDSTTKLNGVGITYL